MTILAAFATILHSIIFLYTWVIIISALLTFVQPNPHNPVVQILYRLTAPVYRFVRRYIPTIFGGIDLAPLFIVLFLQFIDLAFILPMAAKYQY
ncbi:MAG: YggT family protein [Thiovulaceae bacterium]|nr:YggT family protein [Sulfurimonadaceae bacterium]